MDGFRERPEAPADVLAYWDVRVANIVAAFDHRDVWAQEHVQAYSVAKAMRLDIQIALKNAVGDAIKNGTPYAQFAKELTPKLQNMGWWGKSLVTDPLTGEGVVAQLGSPRRLRTIYQANIRSARSAGFWQRAQRTKRALPFLIYQLGPSEVHRPHHVAQEGKVYRVDDPYWNHWLGPNGWGCKCWARQISQSEADRLGGVSPETDLDLKNYTNKRTGEVTKVPSGIDPGWHTNPGISHLNFVNAGRKLNESLLEASHIGAKLEEAAQTRRTIALGFLEQPALANVKARSMGFEDLSKPAQNEIGRLSAPVAILGDARAAHIGAAVPLVQLSVHTLAKQIRKSSEAGRLEFNLVQDVLEDGVILPTEDTHHWKIASRINGQWFWAIIKVTQDGEQIYLQSFRRATNRQIEQNFEL